MGLFDFFKSKDDDESKIGIPSDERTSSFMRPLAKTISLSWKTRRLPLHFSVCR